MFTGEGYSLDQPCMTNFSTLKSKRQTFLYLSLWEQQFQDEREKRLCEE